MDEEQKTQQIPQSSESSIGVSGDGLAQPYATS